MMNIPTELLRTLIAVVDLRSFTKAANTLGVTQPAISAQIKRLQGLLNRELLDKSAPGVMLTPTGELVVSHARKLLQINDQILHLAGPRQTTLKLNLGISGDFANAQLPWMLAGFRARWPDARFETRHASGERLVQDLHLGEFDVIVAYFDAMADENARAQWTEDLVWMRGQSNEIEADGLVPLATCGEGSALHRLAISTLEKAGRSYRVVFTAPRVIDVVAAVVAGFGVTAVPASYAAATGLAACEDSVLPKLPRIACSIHVRDGGNDRKALEQLADGLAEILQAQPGSLDVSEGQSGSLAAESDATLDRRASG